MGINVHDPSKLKDSIAQVVAWGKVTQIWRGTFAVVNAGGVDRANFDFKAARQHRLRRERSRQGAPGSRPAGRACIQHTGSAVDTRDEVYAVMEAVDSRHMKFAPDVGQLQKAGADAAKVVEGFLPITVPHAPQGSTAAVSTPRLLPARPGQGRSRENPAPDERSALPDSSVMCTSSTARKGAPLHPRARPRRSARRFCVKQGYTFRT